MRRAEKVWDWLGEPLAVDFANTVRRSGWHYRELLEDGGDVASWSQRQAGRVPVLAARTAQARLAEIRAVRDDVFALLLAAARGGSPPSDPVGRINARARERPVVKQLGEPGAEPFTLVVGDPDPVDELLARVAAGAIELTGTANSGLALCDAPSCGQFFLRDRTNQRWCGPACGTRARVARHAAHAG
jgi:predicted RNA-binding Zn ribbon-like protein